MDLVTTNCATMIFIDKSSNMYCNATERKVKSEVDLSSEGPNICGRIVQWLIRYVITAMTAVRVLVEAYDLYMIKIKQDQPLDYVAGACPGFVSLKVPHRVLFSVKCCACRPVIPAQVVVLSKLPLLGMCAVYKKLWNPIHIFHPVQSLKFLLSRLSDALLKD